MILAIFMRAGKRPELNDELNMLTRGGAICAEVAFRRETVISS